MKEITSLTVKLLLICGIVAALLAGVNMVTEPIIAANNQKTFESAMAQVLPDAGGFVPVETEGFSPTESGVTLDSVYRAENGGYVVSTVCAEGYGGDVSVMVGITADLKIHQAKIMSMSETPGLGAKAAQPDFINQYSGLSGGIQVIKNSAPTGNQVEAISGATVTSKAVTKAVNAALETAKAVSESAESRKGGASA